MGLSIDEIIRMTVYITAVIDIDDIMMVPDRCSLIQPQARCQWSCDCKCSEFISLFHTYLLRSKLVEDTIDGIVDGNVVLSNVADDECERRAEYRFRVVLWKRDLKIKQ